MTKILTKEEKKEWFRKIRESLGLTKNEQTKL